MRGLHHAHVHVDADHRRGSKSLIQDNKYAVLTATDLEIFPSDVFFFGNYFDADESLQQNELFLMSRLMLLFYAA